MWREIFESVLSLLAPWQCPGCDREVERPSAGCFCGLCESLLERAPSERGADALFEYGGPIQAAIARLKFGGRSDCASRLGALLALHAREHHTRADLVVPVPLHPRRLRVRGYNQSSLLARPVARTLGVALAMGALRRARHTRPQTELSAPQRLINVQDAFVAPHALAGHRILVIDDVRTTGATLAECSKTLIRAGAQRVDTLALARAVP